MTACIVGWSILPCRRDHDDVESMICSVASTINDSGFGQRYRRHLFGHFGGAFSPQVYIKPGSILRWCVSSLLQS